MNLKPSASDLTLAIKELESKKCINKEITETLRFA